MLCDRVQLAWLHSCVRCLVFPLPRAPTESPAHCQACLSHQATRREREADPLEAPVLLPRYHTRPVDDVSALSNS